MAKIGLTGRIGTGKTTVSRLLGRKGAKIFDTDCQVRQIYSDPKNPIYKQISRIFPKAKDRGVISRQKLGDIVFADKHALKELEAIIHPVVIESLRRWLADNRREAILLAEVPLLFESKLEHLFDKTILIQAKEEILLKRLEKKYNLDRPRAKQRLEMFSPDSQKKPDFILVNNSDLNKLKKEVDLLWQKISKI